MGTAHRYRIFFKSVSPLCVNTIFLIQQIFLFRSCNKILFHDILRCLIQVMNFDTIIGNELSVRNWDIGYIKSMKLSVSLHEARALPLSSKTLDSKGSRLHSRHLLASSRTCIWLFKPSLNSVFDTVFLIWKSLWSMNTWTEYSSQRVLPEMA